uniref:Transglutaminase elicitor n=1 Tax=Phytophthora ramorum TaxID=164328 RepID=H3G521_PHYRM
QNNRHLEAELSDIARLESYFGTSIECNFNVLKDSYSSAVCDVLPWSGDYWPSYKDGINFVWKDGDASPAEKYATAFGLEAASFKDSISLSTGVLSESYEGSTCASDSDCDSLGDGSLCGIREGETSGYCIPTWVGICHAWAAAAMFEAEPKCDVVKNNVTFHSVDMKALISQLYDGAAIDVVFTGARFNGPDTPEELDEYGRYVDAARKDINPAFFHIAAANILGKQHQTFIVDVSSNSEVWNQPVQKYEFLETEIIIDTAEACGKHFGTTSYPFNSAMVQLAQVKTTVTWAVEAYVDGPLVSTGDVDNYLVSNEYEYLLELDANDAIIGGEWVGDSKEAHPDFLWFATGKPDTSTVTSVGLSYADVQELLELSLACNS